MKTNRRRSTLTWFALATACAVSLPDLAHAADAPPVEDAATRDAKVRFEEGLKRYESQDYDGARLAFLQAYAVLHAVDILFNLSLSELRSEHPVDALHHLKQYLRDERLTPQERERATKYLAEANGKTGHVWIEAPAGSKLWVDAQACDSAAPLKEAVDVVVGRRVVEVQTGAQKRSVEVNAVAGETVTARFVGDGKPVVVAGGPSGAVDAPKDQAAPAPRGLGTPRNVTTLVLAGGALVALGVGVAFSVAAGSEKDSLDRLTAGQGNPSSSCLNAASAGCAERSDAATARTRDSNVATGMFLGAGGLAVAAAAAYFLWPSASAPTERSAWIAPAIAHGGVGAQLGGRF